MQNDFRKMTEKALEIRQQYSVTDSRRWEVEQVFMGMVKDVGDLSKILMSYGGYREDLVGDTKKKLEHELSDVLFSLMVIANKTEINLEESFWKTMNELEKKLKK